MNKIRGRHKILICSVEKLITCTLKRLNAFIKTNMVDLPMPTLVNGFSVGLILFCFFAFHLLSHLLVVNCSMINII